MKQALLVISFGSSMDHVIESYITPVENHLKRTFPDMDVFQSFTSNFIRKKLAKNGVIILSPEEAIQALMELGYETIIIQPLHIIPGYEFEKIETAVHKFNSQVEIHLSEPLLYNNGDFEDVVKAITPHMPKLMNGEALVFMGHGTSHPANNAYYTMLYYLNKANEHFYLANVEDTPTLKDVIEDLNKKSYNKIYLHPLLLVAGDHALNDMASSDEDSWKSQLEKAGFEVMPILTGLGAMETIQDIFAKKVAHIRDNIR